jgi:hypothetical protein
MNSNQRSEGNNQSDNGANEKSVSSSRGGTADRNNLNQQQGGSQQSVQQDALKTDRQSGQRDTSIGQQQGGGQNWNSDSTDRQGSQTGSRQSNDAAGGLPKSPGGANRLDADEDMDEDTGLSDKGNRQTAIDQGSRQAGQSNVGRRDDGTPD